MAEVARLSQCFSAQVVIVFSQSMGGEVSRGWGDSSIKPAWGSRESLSGVWRMTGARRRLLDWGLGRLVNRPRNRSHPPGHSRRQPPPPHLRSVVRRPMRRKSRPGVLGTYRAPPSQPRRRPPSQQRPLANSHNTTTHRPPHHRIRPKTTGGRQNPKRDHPLSETVHRPPGLPTVNRPAPNTLRRPSPLPTPKHPTTLVQAATALQAHPTSLSQLERGHYHNHHLATRYQTWLTTPPNPICKT